MKLNNECLTHHSMFYISTITHSWSNKQIVVVSHTLIDVLYGLMCPSNELTNRAWFQTSTQCLTRSIKYSMTSQCITQCIMRNSTVITTITMELGAHSPSRHYKNGLIDWICSSRWLINRTWLHTLKVPQSLYLFYDGTTIDRTV